MFDHWADPVVRLRLLKTSTNEAFEDDKLIVPQRFTFSLISAFERFAALLSSSIL